MVPNLYSTPLSDGPQKQAQADPFGTVTLWTYFNNCLRDISQRTPTARVSSQEIQDAAHEDLVYAAFLVFAKDSKVSSQKVHNAYFLKLLNRCVISSPDIVEGAMFLFHGETGLSVLEHALVLQALLAVTIKHHNHELLRHLAIHRTTGNTIFDYCAELIISHLEKSNAETATWDALVKSGWIKKSQVPKKQDTEATKGDPRAFNINGTAQVPGSILSSCAKTLPSKALREYLPYVPRSLYTAIPPQPKWPGDPVLVKQAVARTDEEGLEVLRLFVEIGGMGVNDSVSWWKEGDCDPRDWDSKCKDGSDCTETALHIAVDRGNLKTAEYLLTHGATRIRDVFGRDQWQRALLRKNSAMISLFEKHGWGGKSGSCAVV